MRKKKPISNVIYKNLYMRPLARNEEGKYDKDKDEKQCIEILNKQLYSSILNLEKEGLLFIKNLEELKNRL